MNGHLQFVIGQESNMSPSHLIPSLSGTQNIGNIAHPPHLPTFYFMGQGSLKLSLECLEILDKSHLDYETQFLLL